MDRELRRLNVVLLANPGGGFSNLGHEEYSLAFGAAFAQSAMDNLLARRDAIEQSLLDNLARIIHQGDDLGLADVA